MFGWLTNGVAVVGKVTRGQRLLILIVGLAVVATLVFPPFTMSWPNIDYNMGYAPIFSPPAIDERTASVDIQLLLIQWAGIALAAGCGWLFLASSQTSTPNRRRDNLCTADTLPLSSQAWRRFWATNIDFLLVVAGVNVALWVTGWRWSGQIVTAILVGTLITVALVAVLQAIFLSLFCTTPGKALMGIRVVRGDGKHLTFWAAFERGLDVLVGGCGLYLFFPILQLPLFRMHFNILKREGVLSWDRVPEGNHQVSIVSPSRIRPVIGAVVCIGAILAVSFSTGVMRYKPTMYEMTAQDLENCIQERILTEDQCFLAFLESD